MAPRVLAIGDIHGCLRALEGVLDMARPGPEDTVVALGDYIDRGPDSRGVVERLLALAAETRLVPLLGNHEEMLLLARKKRYDLRLWLGYGGAQTLASYGVAGEAGAIDLGALRAIPEAHWSFFERACRDAWETETHIFTHATLEPDRPVAEQPAEALRWNLLDEAWPAHGSGKTVVCGHTNQRSGRPLDLGHTICIDTWSYGEGFLTCLDVGSLEVRQASERGERRMGSLPPRAARR